MTVVEGERTVRLMIDDKAAVPSPERTGPEPDRAEHDDSVRDGVTGAPAAERAWETDPAEPDTDAAEPDTDDAPRADATGAAADPAPADPPPADPPPTGPASSVDPAPAAGPASADPASSVDPAPAADPAPEGVDDPPPAEDPPATAPTPAPAAPPTPSRRRVVLVAGALALALVLTVGGGAVGAWAALTFRPATPPPAPVLADAVGAVAPAILRIQAGSPETGTAGTALVVTPTGDVVTNEHLVHGESTATLVTPDGQTRTARVVAADEAADVAWLRIDGAQGLPVVRLAAPTAVRPGEDVLAIGNALNLEGPPSVSRGVVSAVGRSTTTLTDVIQTDAAISSGSSGGALVDGSGAVVGITTEALVGDPSVSVEDIAFAIPADRVVTVLRGMGLELPR